MEYLSIEDIVNIKPNKKKNEIEYEGNADKI